MKKILIFAEVFFPVSETFIYRQIVGMRSRYDVELLSREFINEDKFNFFELKRHRIQRRYASVDTFITRVLRKLLAVDLGLNVLDYFSVCGLLKRGNYEVVHAHYGWCGISILNSAKRLKLPLVVSFHGKDASASLSSPEYVVKVRQLLDYASGIIICSPHMFESLALRRWEHKVHLIPYGIDPSYFAPSDGGDHSKIRILHSGRLAPKKGVPDLIRAFAGLLGKYPNIELSVLGDGEERELCSRLVSELGISDNVVFHGSRPIQDVKALMNCSDIFVLNSRTADNGDMEGLPNAILEAMSMELPVIATNHAGISMAVRDGFNGLLIPEKNNEQLYIALESLVVDKDLRKRLGKEARETIISSFTVEQMQEKLNKVFSSV